jgi:hypothetical protein
LMDLGWHKARIASPDVLIFREFPLVMRKMTIILLMTALLIPLTLIGCSESTTAGIAPAGVEGPRPPEMPPGAADAMKNSLKLKPSKKATKGQSGQVPH